MSGPPLIDISGGPRERGRIHGRALASAIRDNVETYLARFAEGGVERKAALAEGKR